MQIIGAVLLYGFLVTGFMWFISRFEKMIHDMELSTTDADRLDRVLAADGEPGEDHGDGIARHSQGNPS